MIRHGTAKRLRAVPIRQVAAGVIAVCHRQAVIVVHMALVAVCGRPRRCHLVVTRQRPARVGVVEGVIGPGNCVVTSRAICRRERGACRRVHRVVRGLPIRQVATGIAAIGRRNRERVVVVDVALGARGDLARRRHLVRVGQRETCGGVIER